MGHRASKAEAPCSTPGLGHGARSQGSPQARASRMTSTPAVDNFYQAQVCQLGCKPALGWASRKASSRPPFGMLLNTGHLDEEERAGQQAQRPIATGNAERIPTDHIAGLDEPQLPGRCGGRGGGLLSRLHAPLPGASRGWSPGYSKSPPLSSSRPHGNAGRKPRGPGRAPRPPPAGGTNLAGPRGWGCCRHLGGSCAGPWQLLSALGAGGGQRRWLMVDGDTTAPAAAAA